MAQNIPVPHRVASPTGRAGIPQLRSPRSEDVLDALLDSFWQTSEFFLAVEPRLQGRCLGLEIIGASHANQPAVIACTKASGMVRPPCSRLGPGRRVTAASV